jgi:endonuclease-3
MAEVEPPLLSPEALTLCFQRLEHAIPQAETELFYTNPYTLLVAVVLSAQATDKGVNKATHTLFKLVDTPEQMLALGEARLGELIATIGLYPTKAKHILALSRQLMEKHASQVPQDRELLQSLPGVGRKTANVVLNVVFHQPTIPVDTHVLRVANRCGFARGKTPVSVEKQLEERIPPAFRHKAHHLLILHGRYTCQARRPKCGHCVLRQLCPYPFKEEETQASTTPS